MVLLLKVASLDEEEIEVEFGDVGVFNTSEESRTLELAGEGRGWMTVVVVGRTQSDNKKVLLFVL